VTYADTPGEQGGHPGQPGSTPAYPGQPQYPGYPGAQQPGQPAPNPYPGPSQPSPAQPYPGQPSPAQPYPGQPTYPAQPTTGQPYPGPSQPSPAQPYPGQPTYPAQQSTPPAPTTAPTEVYPLGQYAQGSYPVSSTPVTSTYPPYAYPGQYPQPPKRKVWPILLIGGLVVFVLIVVLGVGAAIIATGRKNTPTGLNTTGSPTAPVATSPPKPTFVPFSGDLRTLLVARPAGATKDSNDGNGNADGTVTLEQAAQTYSDVEFGKTHMQEFGYQQGATESWHEGDHYSVQIVLFQFRDPADTRDFVSKLEDGSDTDDFWSDRGDVPNVPTGRFYVSAKKNNNGNYNFEIWFNKGGIAARMNGFGPNATDVEKLKTLAQKQYALLP
jgi:hypothetical protein